MMIFIYPILPCAYLFVQIFGRRFIHLLKHDPGAVCGLSELGVDAMDEIKEWSKNFGAKEKNDQNLSALEILEELQPDSKFAAAVKEILVYAPESDKEKGYASNRGFFGKQSWGPRCVAHYQLPHGT